MECAEISSKTYPVWPEGSAVECVEITVQKPTQFGLKVAVWSVQKSHFTKTYPVWPKVAVRSVQKSHFKNLPSLACSAWTVAVRATRSADSCVTTGSRGPLVISAFVDVSALCLAVGQCAHQQQR